ncbi:MAG: RidA family protein [Acetobacterales bacterium]
MRRIVHNPEAVVPPFSAYAHGVEIPRAHRMLFVSGQLGVAKDGSTPPDFPAQCRLAFDNVLAVLRAAGMTIDNVMKINTYLTRRSDIAAYREVRDVVLEGRLAASTVVTVAGLARDDLLVEIEAIAVAGPDHSE